MSDGSDLSLRFEGCEVRFVGTADAPEWVGADVVNVLYPSAIENKNQSTYLSRVPSEWKGSKLVATRGGRQQMTTLYEPGLYCLIVGSESPLAVRFQKWVYEEVLPSIRKTGGYSLPSTNDSLELQHLKLSSEIDELRIKNIRTCLDIMYELGGLDERTELAVRDVVRDMLLKDRLKKASLPGSARREIPISDRARDLGYNPNKTQLQQMGRIAAKLYRAANDGADPPKREQYVDGTTRMVFCYSEEHLEVLDSAIALVMEKPKQIPPSQDDF